MAVPVESDQPRWLLLMFSMPAKRASERVEIWRRLKRIGALSLPSSGYLLPCSPANLEHFEWLAAAIRKYKGEASVARVQSIDEIPDQELIQRFTEARNRDYQQLLTELRAARSWTTSSACPHSQTLPGNRRCRFFSEPVAHSYRGAALPRRRD